MTAKFIIPAKSMTERGTQLNCMSCSNVVTEKITFTCSRVDKPLIVPSEPRLKIFQSPPTALTMVLLTCLWAAKWLQRVKITVCQRVINVARQLQLNSSTQSQLLFYMQTLPKGAQRWTKKHPLCSEGLCSGDTQDKFRFLIFLTNFKVRNVDREKKGETNKQLKKRTKD